MLTYAYRPPVRIHSCRLPRRSDERVFRRFERPVTSCVCYTVLLICRQDSINPIARLVGRDRGQRMLGGLEYLYLAAVVNLSYTGECQSIRARASSAQEDEMICAARERVITLLHVEFG